MSPSVADTITCLRARGRRLAKLIAADGTVVPYDAAKTFDLHEHPVSDLGQLEEALRELLARPDLALADDAVRRRGDPCVAEIDPRQVDLRLPALDGRLRLLDLGIQDAELGIRRPHLRLPALEFGLVGALARLRPLHGLTRPCDAAVEERLLPLRLGCIPLQRRLRPPHRGARGHDVVLLQLALRLMRLSAAGSPTT